MVFNFLKRIMILITFLLVISCSISSKSYVEKKIDTNNKKFISKISKQNSDLKSEISKMEMLLDSLKYNYEQNSFLITNLTNRYNLLTKEISSLEAKKSLDINSIFKKMSSLDKKFQQLQHFVSKNKNYKNQSQDTIVVSDSKVTNSKTKDVRANIDSLHYQFNKLQNEFDLLVKDLSLIENSMMDIIKYSTNRIKADINKKNKIIRQNVKNIHTDQDSLFNLYNEIVNSIDSLKDNSKLIKIDSLQHKDSLQTKNNIR